MSSFRRFQQWYISHLSDAEIDEALEAILPKGPHTKKGRKVQPVSGSSATEKREGLLQLWRERHFDVKIGRFFSQFHKDALQTIKERTLDEIEESVPDLIAKFGLRGTVFALFVGTTQYHREIGARVMRDFLAPKPEQVQNDIPQASETSHLSEKPDEVTSDPMTAHSSVAQDIVVSAFTRLLAAMESYTDTLSIHELEPYVRQLNVLWDRMKVQSARQTIMRNEVSESIKHLRSSFDTEELVFWGVHDAIEALSDATASFRIRDSHELTSKLEELSSLLRRAVELRRKQGSAPSAQELSAVITDLAAVQQSLEEVRAWLQDAVEIATTNSSHVDDGRPDTSDSTDMFESKGGILDQSANAEEHYRTDRVDEKPTVTNEQKPDAHTDTGTTQLMSLPDTDSRWPESTETTTQNETAVSQEVDDPITESPSLNLTLIEPQAPEPVDKPDVPVIKVVDNSDEADRELAPTNAKGKADSDVALVPERGGPVSLDIGDHLETSARASYSYYEKLITNAIAEHDFGTAYWLAREFELSTDALKLGDRGRIPPSWIMLALTMGAEHDWNSSELVKNWLTLGLEHPKAYTELSEQGILSPKSRAYLVSLAAIRPALFAPETGATDWLHDLSAALSEQDEPLRNMIDAVTKFALRGRPLELVVTGRGGEAPWQIRLKEVRHNVEQWRREMAASRSLYALASRVSTLLARNNGPLGELLAAVDSDDVDHMEARKLVLNHLGSRTDFATLINRSAQEVSTGPGKVPDIVGRPRRHLIGRLERLHELLHEWVDVLTARDSSREDWYIASVDEFRAEFLAHWPNAETVLRSSGEDLIALDRALREAVRGSLSALVDQLKDSSTAMEGPKSRSWLTALRRPLLLLETPPLSEEGWPLRDEKGIPHLKHDTLTQESLSERLSEGMTLESAFHVHLGRNEFRTAAFVLDELVSDGHNEGPLAAQLREAWLLASDQLKRQVARTREKVEQSYIEHVLSEDQKSDIDAILLQIEDKLASTEAEANLGAHFEELASIAEIIETTRSARIESLQASIQEHMADSTELVPRAREFIELAKEALDQGDIPVADEYISYAELAQAGADASTFAPPKFENIVPEFVKAIDPISETLQEAQQRYEPQAVMGMLAEGRSVPGIPMGHVPGSRQKEIKQGLTAYYALKRRRPSNPERQARELQKLLEYIGFHVSSVSPEDSGRESLHFKAKMSAGTQSPLAEFGSLRRGIYDVVLFHGRPTATMMGEELRRYRVTNNRPIVIHAGRMTPLQREEWSVYCWENRLTAMLLDEVLLHFLAGQRETRLPAAVSCGVAWGYCMPYRSFGDIPPELFKGRHALVSDIAGPRRTGIVYGGRQFGKTALLRTVERLAHDPDNHTYVIFEDIKHLGHPTGIDQPEALWTRVRDRLAPFGIVSKGLRKPESIIDAIVESAQKDPSLRIILLLDEADNFLNKDAADKYRELEKIRTLQDRTNDQVKVVLSGLHNVQRFYKDSNHPLAQLGGAIPIGPLPTQGARALIEEPLSALGFRFGDESGTGPDSDERVILRILSYTNYHPALIQHFCGELIHLVRQKRTAPPYRITMSDVEAVYRKPEVQAMMKERFEWTIGLDNRYKVIVYGMIFSQLDDNNGFRKSFSAREIYEDVKAAWPEGFANAQADDVQALLDELIGLGVLVRLDNGRYRLRNGNVVRALGTPEEIFMRLDAATKETPEKPQDPGRFRLRLSEDRRSPLMVRQLRQLTEPGSGVGVIFGNRALLNDLIEESLQTYVDSVLAQTTDVQMHEMPLDCIARDPFLRYVQRLYSERGHHIVHCPGDHLLLSNRDFADILGELVAHLAGLRSRRKSVRVVFSLGPAETHRWFQLLGGDYATVEAKIVPITIPLWDNGAVERFFLDEVAGLPYTVTKVMDTTGGWPYLIEKVRHALQSGSADGDTTSIDDIVDQLANLERGDNAMRHEFLQVLGVMDIPLGLNLLRFLKDEAGVVKWNEAIELPRISDDPSLQQAERADIIATINTLLRLQLLTETSAGFVVNNMVARAISNVAPQQ